MTIAARIPLCIALIALATLALSGIGVRQGWWTLRLGFQMLEWSAYGGLAAAACAIFMMIIPKLRTGAVTLLALSIGLGLLTGYVPWQHRQQARALPKIHDISTDLINPPLFVKILPLRASAPNPAAYGGPEVAAAQKIGYPDIGPRDLTLTPTAAFASSVTAAKSMGWELVDADASKGIIEATATTLWFGFKDDVVIRITPTAAGSRVDMRSVSRVGKSDVGANAARIRDFFTKLADK